jgi:tetratricopeptide (TPR) repeat protein
MSRFKVHDFLELGKLYHPFENPEDIDSLYYIKDRLDILIKEKSYRQVCKRFLNHIIKNEPHNRMLRAFIPILVLESAYVLKAFRGVRDKEEGLFKYILKYTYKRQDELEQLFKRIRGTWGLDKTLLTLDYSKDRRFLLALSRLLFFKRKDSTLRFIFRMSHTLFPQVFIGLNDFLQERFSVVSINSYLRMLEFLKRGLKEEELKKNPLLLRDIEITILMSLDEFLPKHNPILGSLGFDLEYELSMKAIKLWDKKKFYEAHEILEDIWSLKKGDKIAQGYLQGIIRLAIAYEHLRARNFEAAQKVFNMAIEQIEEFGNRNPNTLLRLSDTEKAFKSIKRALAKRSRSIYVYPRLILRESKRSGLL